MEKKEKTEMERQCWNSPGTGCNSACIIYETNRSHPCGLIRRFDDLIVAVRERTQQGTPTT